MNFTKLPRTSFLTLPRSFLTLPRTVPVAASERWKIVKPIALQITFFTQVTGNRASDHYARNVYIYKGLSMNSCSVDVSAIKNTSAKQQIR